MTESIYFGHIVLDEHAYEMIEQHKSKLSQIRIAKHLPIDCTASLTETEAVDHINVTY
jgi:hypothetical protein